MSAGRSLRRIWNGLAVAAVLGSSFAPLTVAVEPAAHWPILPIAQEGGFSEAHSRLIRGGMQGHVGSLQTLLHGEFEANWPEHRGHLVFLPYDGEFAPTLPRDDFIATVWSEFQRTELAKQLAVSPTALEAVLKRGAGEIYDDAAKTRANRLPGGHVTRWTITLPAPEPSVPEAQTPSPPYKIVLMRLQTPCLSCDALKTRREGGQCRAVHPDEIYIAQSEQLRIAFHELGHIIAEARGDEGSSYQTPRERTLEEVRANLFGALAATRILGGSYVGEFRTAMDRTALAASAERYFNPAAYQAAAEWIEGVGVASLPKRSLLELYDVADRLAHQTLPPEDEIVALKAFIAAGQSTVAREVVVARLARYDSASEQMTQVMVNGKLMAYPPLVVQYDRARLNLLSGNPALAAQLQKNVLRPGAMQQNEPYALDKTQPTQVGAYNQLNRALYGDEACQVAVTPSLPPSRSIQLAAVKGGALPRGLHRPNGVG